MVVSDVVGEVARVLNSACGRVVRNNTEDKERAGVDQFGTK